MKGAIFEYSGYKEKGLVLGEDGRIYKFTNFNFLDSSECQNIEAFSDMTFEGTLEGRIADNCKLIDKDDIDTFIFPDYLVLSPNNSYWDEYNRYDSYKNTVIDSI